MRVLLHRSSLLCLLALQACAPQDPVEAVASTEAPREMDRPAVVVDGPGELSVLPHGDVALRVRYVDPDGAVAGVPVDFALSGAPQGASLTATKVDTDATGTAETKLQVGSMPGSITVRARAGDAAAVLLTVHVGAALDATMSVGVAYEGMRAIDSFTVTALDGMTCEEALKSGVAGSVVYRFDESERRVAFQLPADLKTAVLAWGRDASGAQLARGCTEFRAPITAVLEDAEADLVVMLSDLPMRFAATLPLVLEVDVQSALAPLAHLAEDAVGRVVGSAMHAEAAFYLNAIARRAETPVGLDAERHAALGALLAEEGVGPVSLGRHLGALLATRGEVIELRGAYGPNRRASIDSVRARPSDGAGALNLDLAPPLSLTAMFDAERATWSLETLMVELGLRPYGQSLLAALTADGSVVVDQLEARSGCHAVVAPWAEQRGICDAATAEAACAEAVAELYGAVDEALAAMPTTPVTLMGEVAAYDRSGDGIIDDLGPKVLQGAWGDVAIAAELRVQALTGLTR